MSCPQGRRLTWKYLKQRSKNNPGLLMKSVFFLSLLWIGLTGCSVYHLGAPAELPFDSIYVAPATNRSTAPQAQAILTQQVVDALLREGVKVTDKQSAEATLELEITDYQKSISATQPEDTLLAESFALVIEAHATLVNNRTGKAWFTDRRHTSSQDVYVDEGFQSSEYQATPVLLQRLAVNIKDTVVSVW